MISIFAVDPKICERLAWFKYITEHCDIMRGCAMADLPPGEWCQEVLSHIKEMIYERTLGEVDGKRLKILLARVRNKLVIRPDTDWNYLETRWLENAESEHARDPFAGVISPQYEEGQNNTGKFHPDDLDATVEPWNTRSVTPITRSKNAFPDAVAPMLGIASSIHFVDRGFNVNGNSLYTRSYTRMFRRLSQDRESEFPDISIHCCPNGPVSQEEINFFEEQFADIYCSLLPEGRRISLLLWEVEVGEHGSGAHPFHNRLVITDRFGVMVGYGTDSARGKTDAPDKLIFLDADEHALELRLCCDQKRPMVFVRQPFVFEGTGGGY